MSDLVDLTTLRLEIEASTIAKQSAFYFDTYSGNDTGICEHCDKPIPEKRLVAIPSAKYCVRCQQLADDGKL